MAKATQIDATADLFDKDDATSISAEGPAVRSRMKETVLVVDDEPSIVRLTSRFLMAAGIEAIGVESGAAALEVLDSHQVDAIISDVSMPEMSGVELVRAIRQRDVDVPVIMVTGGPSVESAIDAIEQGVYRYLIKPVAPDTLVATAVRAIHLRKLARAKEELLKELGSNAGIQSDHMGLEAAFDNALATLWPAFQPIVRTSDRSLFGYEALLRNDDPRLPNPGAVVDAAERLQQLPRLFRTMRERSCQVLVEGGSSWHMFLNLHPRDLNDLGLLDPNSLVCRCAKHIILEVTERATLDQVPDVRRRISRLREAGYRIAIDDLGAGYSGLNSFASLEPEFVKFDMALVRDIQHSEVKQRLMRVLSSLCHDMGMQVVAEGIETTAERDTVIEMGCDLLQGFLLGQGTRVPRAPLP
jgi:EAL domain-containing protein (putative c-di-GMP-specific phosphodiesterase class I)